MDLGGRSHLIFTNLELEFNIPFHHKYKQQSQWYQQLPVTMSPIKISDIFTSHCCFAEISKYCLHSSLLEITVVRRPLLDLIVRCVNKEVHAALAGWLSWLEQLPMHQKFVGSIPGQGTYPGYRFDPHLRHI